MSASDNLSGQLFHGSIHPFKKGDVIKPQEHSEAFATDSSYLAGYYSSRGNWRAGFSDQKTQPEGKNKTKDNPVLFGTVYKVEPVNKADVKVEDYDDRNVEIGEQMRQVTEKKPKIHTSPSGFRVTGIHSLQTQQHGNEDFVYPTRENQEYQRKTLS